ncbi:MAG: ribonuclease Z [Bacteroidetes bacterium]|nr:ribonuclease Z [Bacteroidota bacterium]
MPFKLVIIGSGAAVPTLQRGVTSQYLNFNERRILIDCGEGTQLQLRKYGVRFQRLQYIFISHLHGDHFLGIFGLLASMNLLGRTQKLIIFGPDGLEKMIRFQFELTKVTLDFELEFQTIHCKTKTLIFEDRVLEIFAFPLKHRIECYGFLFKEKPKERNIDKDQIEKYAISLAEIWAVKNGSDLERDGKIIPNDQLTLPPAHLLSYAFCTDTRYYEKAAGWIKGADLLYHEATFSEKQLDRAKATHHSTAAQAAALAKKAEVRHLLIGHFSARFTSTAELKAEASAVFENTTCVEDGDEFVL